LPKSLVHQSFRDLPKFSLMNRRLGSRRRVFAKQYEPTVLGTDEECLPVSCSIRGGVLGVAVSLSNRARHYVWSFPQKQHRNADRQHIWTGSRAVLPTQLGSLKSVSAIPPIPGITVMDPSTYALCLVSRVTPVQTASRNCTGDGGGPFGFGDQVADPKPPQAAAVKSRGGERCGKVGAMIPAGMVERGERKRTVAEVSKAY